jgi:hypothetical protein
MVDKGKKIDGRPGFLSWFGDFSTSGDKLCNNARDKIEHKENPKRNTWHIFNTKKN